MINSKTLGSRLRELRQARGYSMRELVSRSGLKSVAFIADLERGFRHPSPEVLVRIASALNVPLAELREYDLRPPLQEISVIASQDPAWSQVFRRIVDLSEAGRLTPKSLLKLLGSTTSSSNDQATLPF